jgi:hypothetical protein
MPHIKNDIGYKSGDKHNSRIYTNNKEFIKFTKGNTYQDKKQILNNTNHTSYANASYVSHMSYHDFGASYVLMRNNFGKDVEGPEKATRGGGVNGSQSKFLVESWPISLNQPDASLF